MASIEVVLAVVRCGAQICVARRSQAVATSRGQWSVVTGYVEPRVEPRTQAWTELAEELGLGPDQLVLRRELAPVSLTSPSSGKAFLVHPLLFDSSSTRVVLNWEHEEVKWVEPDWLDQPGCVPWQAEVVRSLLAEP
jgi:8-oxo-dGTP diphosphatase